jgi:hypothetical protein
VGVSFPEVVEQGRSDEVLPIGLSTRYESCAAQAMPLIGHRLIEKGFELGRAKPISDLGFLRPRQGLGSQNVEKPNGQVTPAGMTHRLKPVWGGQERFDLQSTQ